MGRGKGEGASRRGGRKGGRGKDGLRVRVEEVEGRKGESEEGRDRPITQTEVVYIRLICISSCFANSTHNVSILLFIL